MRVETISPSHSGTAAVYADAEQLLDQAEEYEVLEFKHEMLAAWVSSATSLSTQRQAIKRFRDGLSFNKITVRKIQASFGGAKNDMLFVWKVPEDPEQRNESQDAAAVVEVNELLPKYHTRAQMHDFIVKYKSPTNLKPSMLRRMYQTLTSNAGAAHDANEREVDERVIEFIGNTKVN